MQEMEAREGSRGRRNALCACKVTEAVTKKMSAWKRKNVKKRGKKREFFMLVLCLNLGGIKKKGGGK